MLGWKARTVARSGSIASVFVLASACVLASVRPARASDAGLAQLASAMQRVQDAPRGEEARVQASQDALAVLDRAPALVNESAAGRYARSRLLMELGRIEEALAALPDLTSAANAQSLPVRVANDVRLRRAEQLAQLGRCAEALPLLVALEDVVGSAAIGRARTRCTTPAVETSKRAAPAPMTPEQTLTRAEKLTEEGRGEEALQLIDAMKLPKSLKARGMHSRGMALFRMRTRYAEAARVLASASMLASPTAEEDAFFAARALARDDQDRRAVKSLRAFAQRYRTSKRAGEALYLAAWLELRAGGARKKTAAQALATWLESAHAKTHPDMASEGQLELGMHALLSGQPTVAGERFGRYAAMTQGCLERGRGFYWGAQAYLAIKQQPQAIALFNEAARIEPLCYYALLARARLQALGEPAPPAYGGQLAPTLAIMPSSADAGALAAIDASVAPVEGSATPIALAPNPIAVPLPSDVAFYASIGLFAEAVAALRVQEPAVRASAPSGRGAEALIRAYHVLGEHSRARAIVHQEPAGLLTSPPSAQNAWAFEAAYARPYPDQVAALAQSEQLDADMIYSVMLKESAFDPKVVSNADAVGLMQLLPSTGKSVGRELGITVTRETLFDPRQNLALGARFLRQLMRRYEGQAPLAIAAYNAGSHRVDAWLSKASRDLLARRSKEPIALDLFVEQIPIEQTRNYVRRVLGFMARYRYLRDGVVVALPESVFVPGSSERRRR